MEGKKCTKCDVWKVLDEFSKDKLQCNGYRPSCKVCSNARNKLYAKSNKEKIKNKKHNYYLENKETILKRTKKYYQKNKEYYKNYHAEYYEGNYEKYYNSTVKRRSYNFQVSFTPLQRNKILDRDNWICQCCGILVHDEKINNETKAHIDHIIPISKGGNSEPSNLQVLCRTCNLSKGNKIMK